MAFGWLSCFLGLSLYLGLAWCLPFQGYVFSLATLLRSVSSAGLAFVPHDHVSYGIMWGPYLRPSAWVSP